MTEQNNKPRGASQPQQAAKADFFAKATGRRGQPSRKNPPLFCVSIFLNALEAYQATVATPHAQGRQRHWQNTRSVLSTRIPKAGRIFLSMGSTLLSVNLQTHRTCLYLFGCVLSLSLGAETIKGTAPVGTPQWSNHKFTH